MIGTLFVVATPIGNLKDISERALDVLRGVDLIACEDTRHTGKLLKHFEIKKSLISYHAFNETDRKTGLIEELLSGKDVAIVSDAGMPGISDPGYELVAAARAAGSTVVVIPGATAFVTAAVLSGMPTDSIYFGGFLPPKKTARRKALEAVSNLNATLVFYESPNRIAAALKDCLAILGPRKAAIVRELTKLHEETITGALDELVAKVAAKTLKGEIVLVFDRQKPHSLYRDPDADLLALIKEYESGGLNAKAALKRAAKDCGLSKPEAYRIVQASKST